LVDDKEIELVFRYKLRNFEQCCAKHHVINPFVCISIPVFIWFCIFVSEVVVGGGSLKIDMILWNIDYHSQELKGYNWHFDDQFFMKDHPAVIQAKKMDAIWDVVSETEY